MARPEHPERIRSKMIKLAELQRHFEDPVPLDGPNPKLAVWSPAKPM